MKDYKKLLASFIEVITFLLAAFGGFLKKIAPPDQVGAAYAVGMMSFLMLIVLLTISAIARQASAKLALRRWVGAGVLLFVVALPACFLYPYMLSHYTYPQRTELSKRRISAPDEYLTADARRYRSAQPNATSDDLDRNLPDGDVWTQTGVERTASRLLAAYAWLVLSLSGAVFCLLEANIGVKTG